MGDKKLYITRGDDVTKILNFEDNSGNAINITGWTVFFTVKKSYLKSDDEALIKKDITSHSDPSNGKTKLVINASDTDDMNNGDYYYDIQVKKGDGKINTVLNDIFVLDYDVTRRTS